MSLPALPEVLFRILDACEADNRNMQEIAALVRQDAALAARVLALSTSPAFGLAQNDRKLTLEQTLMLLGINALRTLALTAAVYQFMDQSLGAHRQRHENFWQEALLTATLASKLADLSGYPSVHEAYLGGLISNIGQIGMLVTEPELYDDLLDQAGTDTSELVTREKTLFGLDHASLGGKMLSRSGRRGPLTDAVRFHHASVDELTEAHHLVRLVAVANRLGCDASIAPAAGLVAADRILGLIPSLLNDLHASAVKQTRETARAFGIETSSRPQKQERADGSQTSASKSEHELARRLGDMNILSAARKQLEGSEQIDDLLASADLANHLIFGMNRIGYFLVDDQAQSAQGQAPTNSALTQFWSEFRVALPSTHSLVGATLTNGTTESIQPWQEPEADNAQPSVLDLELLDLLHTAGFFSIPLCAQGQIVGSMIVGVNADDALRITQRHRLLEWFAGELAQEILGLNRRNKALAEALREQAEDQRLKARSVVHETNNPLSIIQNYLGILGRHIDEGHTDVADDLRIINEEIGRVGTIVRSLTETGDVNEDRKQIDLNALVKDVIQLLRPTLITPAGIGLELHLDDSLPPIEASHRRVKQILVNLIKNAAEALDRGQIITVSTSDYVYLGQQAYVALDVGDNGPGMPPQILASLFKPVATLKGGSHAGLGLSITKKLVDELHGTITCRSSHSQGTHFQVLIPRRLLNA
ncbi:HDOD domain-containing protein [Acidihalobacter aeolianus]|nr:HDOD domain-containing protein [Acidihalobacter aeolianus]